MWQLQPELLMDWAGRVSRLKMFPYFDIAHYTLMCMAVRDDLATGASPFSRRHPFACWLSSILMCFGGSFLANLLMGEPLIVPFKNNDAILLASIVWYIVFYSPFDIAYKLLQIFPIKLAFALAKEVQRAHKVHTGVHHAAKVYPNAYLVIVLIGTAKGAGSGIVRTFEQLVRGVWQPAANEFLKPTFYTKACLMGSLVFLLEKKGIFVGYPHDIVYLAVVAFFVYFKLNALLFHIHDPLAPFENLFCAVFMGGIWDAFSRAVQTSRDRRTESTEEEPNAVPAPAANGTAPQENKKEA